MNHSVYNSNDIKEAMSKGIRLLWVRLPKKLCLVDLKASYYPNDTVAVMKNNHITAKRLLFGKDYAKIPTFSNVIGRIIWSMSNPEANIDHITEH